MVHPPPPRTLPHSIFPFDYDVPTLKKLVAEKKSNESYIFTHLIISKSMYAISLQNNQND